MIPNSRESAYLVGYRDGLNGRGYRGAGYDWPGEYWLGYADGVRARG